MLLVKSHCMLQNSSESLYLSQKCNLGPLTELNHSFFIWILECARILEESHMHGYKPSKVLLKIFHYYSNWAVHAYKSRNKLSILLLD